MRRGRRCGAIRAATGSSVTVTHCPAAAIDPSGGETSSAVPGWSHMETFRLLIGPDEGANAYQLCLRAVLLFAFGIACIRIAGRRTFGQYSPLDIIVALIVGSNLSRVMTGKADFFPVLAATLVLVVLHRVLALATLHWGWLSWLVKARPVRLISNGRIDEHALKRANISREDLEEALRHEQVNSPDEVAIATMEGGGEVSVVPARQED